MSYLKSKLPESLPAETVREPWRQVLLDAAEYIRVHGWCTNRMRHPDGRVCAWGALSIGANAFAVDEAFRKLWAFVGNVPRWNDAPGRTASEVIAALEGAARSALRDGGK